MQFGNMGLDGASLGLISDWISAQLCDFDNLLNFSDSYFSWRREQSNPPVQALEPNSLPSKPGSAPYSG